MFVIRRLFHFLSSRLFIVIAVVFVVVLLLARMILFPTIQIVGVSMQPVFSNNDFALVNRLAYIYRTPQRGDVVVFRHPITGQFYVKRVAAVPGDVVNFQNDDWRSSEFFGGHVGNVLQDGEYIVLGDNRQQSSDSRYFGILNRYDIVGKVLGKLGSPIDIFSY